jgi:hypothetical protein|tara:strand:+ start:1532 stop:1774 length:243 start_codon:yes stop_codon:yes gene_type:complete
MAIRGEQGTMTSDDMVEFFQTYGGSEYVIPMGSVITGQFVGKDEIAPLLIEEMYQAFKRRFIMEIQLEEAQPSEEPPNAA